MKEKSKNWAPLLNIDSLWFSSWFSSSIYSCQTMSDVFLKSILILFNINQFEKWNEEKSTVFMHNSFTFHKEPLSRVSIGKFLDFCDFTLTYHVLRYVMVLSVAHNHKERSKSMYIESNHHFKAYFVLFHVKKQKFCVKFFS